MWFDFPSFHHVDLQWDRNFRDSFVNCFWQLCHKSLETLSSLRTPHWSRHMDLLEFQESSGALNSLGWTVIANISSSAKMNALIALVHGHAFPVKKVLPTCEKASLSLASVW